MDMEKSFSKRAENYLRDISQLFKDATEQNISKEEIASRLAVLKAEQGKLEKSGMFPLNMPIKFAPEKDNTMQTKKVSPPSQTSSTSVPQRATHELDFKCQCKSCVSKHTITMQDQVFLKGLRILWHDPKKSDKAVRTSDGDEG